ncbi:MAG: transcription antitermination factor NusB [Candidatus Margulisbacteria bacterium]|nr:transcription antitermination factor NusB [Candidatus Margulisiibacteriota bacterium]
MGKRTTGRKLAMQIMYQTDIRKEPVTEVIESFFKETLYVEATIEWASRLAKGAWEHHEQSDVIISKYAIDWEIDRINPIDKNILRMALYELKMKETPMRVILDEAIELSREYSTEESPKFLNGILGNYVKKECLPES